MKKITIIISSLLLPILCFAQEATEKATVSLNMSLHKDAMEFFNTLANWLFTFALAATPLMIIVGAFMLVTAAGNPDRITLGRKVILWTIIGFVILSASKGIIALIGGILNP